MSKKNGRRGFLCKVLESLSDEDLVRISYILRDWDSWKHLRGITDIRSSVKNMNGNNLCRDLGFIIFGWRGTGANYALVLENIPDLKLKLLAVEIPTGLLQAGLGKGPSELFVPTVVEHPAIGKVEVSLHAWNRFFERQLNRAGSGLYYLDTRVIQEKIRKTFFNSKEVSVSKSVQARRLIDNDFIPVRYFYNQSAGLRFIVSCDNPQTIITVEKPF